MKYVGERFLETVKGTEAAYISQMKENSVSYGKHV